MATHINQGQHMHRGRSPLWVFAVADFVLTFPYAFITNAIPIDRSGPSAPLTYWLTQLWVYELIAPIAGVAAWRGIRHVQRMRHHRARWWRLTAEAAAIGAFPITAVALFERAAIFRAILEAASLGAGLGLVLTGVNAALDRRDDTREANAR